MQQTKRFMLWTVVVTAMKLTGSTSSGNDRVGAGFCLRPEHQRAKHDRQHEVRVVPEPAS